MYRMHKVTSFRLNWISILYRYLISTLVIVFVTTSVKCHETDMRKELILTLKEKQAFDKFKSKVWPNVTQGHGFMKSDLFLLRWIRAKDLNVGRAVREFHDCLEWRRVNRIDTIHDEDWSDLAVDYPYRMDVIDLQGRPVAMGSLGGRWDIRRGILQGKHARLARYAYKLVEEIFDRLYHVNHLHPNVTQFSVIVSMEGFNVFQQACPVCLATYVQLLTNYNRFYPNFAHAIISINTPPSFSVILDLLRPMLNKPTREALKVFSYNKKQWKAVLDQEVDENLLTYEFGGTKPDDDFSF